MTLTPPSWAEALLRVFLTPADFDSVSGDLPKNTETVFVQSVGSQLRTHGT